MYIYISVRWAPYDGRRKYIYRDEIILATHPNSVFFKGFNTIISTK